MPVKNKQVFPKGFLWGASTAAHQVEGGNHNQWSVWELAHAKQLATSAKSRLGWLANWDDIKSQAQDPANYISGRGVDHYKRYEEDFDILKGLNLNSFRFGVEWSRLEPEQGQWDETAVEHYRTYIKALKKRGIEPVLNIWHTTLPVWFADKGGFKNRKNLRYFDHFVELVAQEFAADLKYIITLNEPNPYTLYGYILGEPITGLRWPPGEKSLISATRVYLNLVSAHRRAYKILKTQKPSLQIGVAMHWANIQAKHSSQLLDSLVTRLMRYLWNNWFLFRIRRQQDFIGINYYFTDYYGGWLKRQNPAQPVSDLGWYMEPEGLYPLLIRAWKLYKKPIIVTESGVADEHDQYRRWWIEQTIVAMERATSEGVKIDGYFHWSLLDNFEWAYGWWPKFGLVAVDRKDGMKRTVRDSAKWFANHIADKG